MDYITDNLYCQDKFIRNGDPWENRTPVTAVKGRCLDRLTNGPRNAGPNPAFYIKAFKRLVAEVGLEPTTYRV